MVELEESMLSSRECVGVVDVVVWWYGGCGGVMVVMVWWMWWCGGCYGRDNG